MYLESFIGCYFFENLDDFSKKVFLEEKFVTQKNLDFNKSYVFFGTSGNGKTVEAVIMLREYVKIEFPDGFDIVRYKFLPTIVKFNDLIIYAEDIISDNGELRYIAKMNIDEIINTEFLLIDELDLKNLTKLKDSHIKDLVYKIFDMRYSSKKQTIITTNRNKQELIDYYGMATVDRLLGLCEPIKFTGNSIRSQIKW